MKRDASTRASALLKKSSGGFEPTRADREKTRAAIARRLAIGVAAGAAVSAGAKSAVAAPSIAPVAGAGAAGVAAGAGSIGSAATGAASVGLATKVVAAIAIFGTVSAGAIGVQKMKAAPTTTNAPIAMMTPMAGTTPTVAPTPETTNTAAAQDVPVENAAPIETAAPLAVEPVANPKVEGSIAKPARNEPVRATAPALQTGAEVALFAEAQHAIDVNEGERALTLLDEEQRAYPNGAFVEEREAARVFALCEAGRQDEARAKADAFLVAYPRSVQAARVRAACVK